jgi:plastocyanin
MADAWRQRAVLACAAAVPLLLAGAGTMPASASATIATKVTAEDGPSCGVGAPANGFCWVPSTVRFQGSGTVQWQSQSTANHYVEADDQSWGGPVDLNHTFARGFGSPGTYKYHCLYHHNMTGVITVTAASSSSSSSTTSTDSGSTTFTVAPPSSTSTTTSRSTTASTTQTTTDVASVTTVDSASTDDSASSATTSGQPPVAAIGASGHGGGGGGSSGVAIAVGLLAVLAAAGGGAVYWRRRHYRFGVRIPRG